ncbi:MAG TPA: hypothetical protein DCS93_08645 [Microscillaceae bacterium]|nr:hypothetical protein [Microscillaceae bacterium]
MNFTSNEIDLNSEEEKHAWNELFRHFTHFSGSAKPTKTWIKTITPLVEVIDADRFATIMEMIVLEISEDKSWLYGVKSKMLKGLLWAGSLVPVSKVYASMAKVISRAYVKVRGKGATAASVGNAGIKALVAMNTKEAMQQLILLKNKTQYSVFVKALNKGIQELSAEIQVTEEDVLDQLMPDFSLEEGVLEQKFGEYTVQVYLETAHKAIVEWIKPDGKVQKSDPAEVKREYSLELKAFKETVKDIKKTLQSQRHRLEASWRKKRVWEPSHWKKHLWDHVLAGYIVHKVIWQFEADGRVWTGIGQEGQLVNVKNEPLNIPENVEISLWHPVNASVEEVLVWRDYMFDHEIKQPFKQAFREVYLVTEAERITDTYSNRFSAHILQHNKLWALAQQREWQYQGAYGYGLDSPTIELPAYNLEVSLDVTFGGDTFDYVTTQRTIFNNPATDEPYEMDEVPLLAFSEMMRDIDLFIAVCSIGSDPNWDGRDDYEDYWYEYSYGDKSDTVSARNRKEILERVIPRLKIAQQCSFEGNFLVVKGQRRTYKINLGSSNILMKPNDQYLCIVPDRKAENKGGKIFLPFEGDSILSLIISKAFLLADDTNIDDDLILSQIGQSAPQ